MTETIKTDAAADERQVAALFELSAAAVDESTISRLADHAATVATRRQETPRRSTRLPWLALAAGLLAMVVAGLWSQASDGGRPAQVAVAVPSPPDAQLKALAPVGETVGEDVLVSTEALAELAAALDPLASSLGDPLGSFGDWDDEDEEWNALSQGGEDEVSE